MQASLFPSSLSLQASSWGESLRSSKALKGVLAAVAVLLLAYGGRYLYRAWLAAQPVASAEGPFPVGSLAQGGLQAANSGGGAVAPASPPSSELLRSALLRKLRDVHTVSLFLYYEPTPVGAPLQAVPLVTLTDVFTLAVDPTEQALVLTLLTHRSDTDTTTTSYTMRLPNVTASRWHGITIAVSGRTVDLYHDGRLVRAVRLDTLPKARPTTLVLDANVGTNLTGSVAKVRAYDRRVPAPEVARLYKDEADERGAPRLPTPLLPALLGPLCTDESCGGAGGVVGDGLRVLVHELE